MERILLASASLAFVLSMWAGTASAQGTYVPWGPGAPLYSYYTGDYGQASGTIQPSGAYIPQRPHDPLYSYYTGNYGVSAPATVQSSGIYVPRRPSDPLYSYYTGDYRSRWDGVLDYYARLGAAARAAGQTHPYYYGISVAGPIHPFSVIY